MGARPVARPKSQRVQIAKSFASNSTRQGSNDGELLHPKYRGCKGKHQRVQRDGGAIAGGIDGAFAPNAPAWLRAWPWVQNNFRRALLGTAN